MRNGGSADPSLGADHGEDSPHRLRIRRGIQAADRAHDVERVDRSDQIIADAAADQFAIQRHVVVAADHDHPGAGVTDFRQRIQSGENHFRALLEFQHDHIRGRRRTIGLRGRGHAAHLDFQMGLAEPAVFAGGLNRGGGLDRFAESLDRDARRRRNMLVARRKVRLLRHRGLGCFSHHFATSLTLPRSAFG